jgi:hypothetical protein
LFHYHDLLFVFIYMFTTWLLSFLSIILLKQQTTDGED